MAAAVPFTLRELYVYQEELHVVVWFIAGLFVLIAVPMSIHQSTLRCVCSTLGAADFIFAHCNNVTAHDGHSHACWAFAGV